MWIHNITKYKKKSILIGGIIILIAVMAITNTLSYPYILISRQIGLTKYCAHGGINELTTREFGFQIISPTGYCLLPHRLFPADGSIQVVPNGNYSVINEYAKGSIIKAAQATILFEKAEAGRSPQELVEKMRQGRFLDEAQVSEFTNKKGLHIVLLKNTIGLDETSHYDWAFIMHPNGTVLFSILTAHPENPDVFNYVIDNISAIEY
jgi:hypothetical protein